MKPTRDVKAPMRPQMNQPLVRMEMAFAMSAGSSGRMGSKAL